MGEGISAASGGEGWVNHLSSRTFLGSILKPAQCEEFFRHIPGPRKNRLEIAIALLSFRGPVSGLPPDMERRLPSTPQVLFLIHSRSYSVIPPTSRTVNR